MARPGLSEEVDLDLRLNRVHRVRQQRGADPSGHGAGDVGE